MALVCTKKSTPKNMPGKLDFGRVGLRYTHQINNRTFTNLALNHIPSPFRPYIELIPTCTGLVPTINMPLPALYRPYTENLNPQILNSDILQFPRTPGLVSGNRFLPRFKSILLLFWLRDRRGRGPPDTAGGAGGPNNNSVPAR